MKKLTNILRNDLSYCEPELKNAFHVAGRAALRAVAKELGLQKGEYDLRSNKAGIAVSGEVTLHTDWVYVQISQSCCNLPDVMYRLCDGRKDYTGKHNHFCPSVELERPAEFAKRLINLRDNPRCLEPQERWARTMWM